MVETVHPLLQQLDGFFREHASWKSIMGSFVQNISEIVSSFVKDLMFFQRMLWGFKLGVKTQRSNGCPKHEAITTTLWCLQ